MIRDFNVQDMVEKKVVPFGNGSIVYTPKKWIGQKVSVILEKPSVDEVQDNALEELKPWLKSIEGIYLFGSFAREEQTKDSDIDVLVISNKKIELKNKAKFDFLVKTKEELLKELKDDKTLFLHQVLQEAKPVINENLLREIKQAETRPDYNAMLENTVGAFKNVKELLEASKKQGLKCLDSNVIIYSLMLRLKGLVLAQCLAKKQDYSDKILANALKKHGFGKKEISDFLAAYRAERGNKKTFVKILLADAEKLFKATKQEFVKTEKIVKA